MYCSEKVFAEYLSSDFSLSTSSVLRILITRHASQIQIQLNYMTDVYNKLETLQKECAVTRSARHLLQSKDTMICQLHELITFYWTTFRGNQNQNHQTLVVVSLGRPEVQTQILQLCAGCTKTDVALNNLVVRARIGFMKNFVSHWFMWVTKKLSHQVIKSSNHPSPLSSGPWKVRQLDEALFPREHLQLRSRSAKQLPRGRQKPSVD